MTSEFFIVYPSILFKFFSMGRYCLYNLKNGLLMNWFGNKWSLMNVYVLYILFFHKSDLFKVIQMCITLLFFLFCFFFFLRWCTLNWTNSRFFSPQMKARIEAHSEVKTNGLLWAGLALLSIQGGAMAWLTWWVYSWDIMEPVTYFITFSNSMVFFAYFLVTRQVSSLLRKW